MNRRLLASGILGLCALWALAYVVRYVLDAGWADPILLQVGTTLRFVALATAAAFAFSSARGLSGSPSRLPWTLLAIGLSGFAVGQGSLAVHQLSTGQTPFPSIADLFFVGAYPFLLAAFVLAIRAYHLAGLPIGTPRDHALLALGTLVAVMLVGTPVLEPILAAPATPLERGLNTAYPALDLLSLIPILVLIRINARFAGGEVAAVWASLLTGFIFLALADVTFAHFQVLGQSSLDPLLGAGYMLAYGFMARGTILQREIVSH